MWESQRGWVYRMQPENGPVRVVSEPIVAFFGIVVNFQEQIQCLWKEDVLLRRESANRVKTII